ncbi:hypothetical protein Q1695_015834 [Nippostrongylus brasiliensis]|nr:hypothetical protein Q1695_015834 [Nippostrongylus brasiliensis]
MRLLFLVLLLTVVVSGGFIKDLGSKVKGVFSGENSIGQKLKNATITGFHKVFNTTAVHKIREKLRQLKDKVVKTLKLTPEMMKSLKERLQPKTESSCILRTAAGRLWADSVENKRYRSEMVPSWLNQFTKQTTATNDNYGMQYDYGSIMHYHGRSASINQKFTMVPFDVKYQETLGSPFISFIELSMLNEHYGCKKRCERSGAAVCQNGGFPHPRDCNKCICPSGYGGPLCDRRPDGCGSTLQAKNEWQTLTDTVGLGRGEELEFEKCSYWIESPPNTKIEVKIDSFTRGLATDGCIYAGVEINTQKDQQLTGYRFCAPEDAGQRLTSYSNRVPIMTYNRAFKSTVVLQYRYIDAGGGQRPIIPVGPNDRKTIRPVIPNGGDGQRPVFPPSSRLTTKAAPTENCVDRVSMRLLFLVLLLAVVASAGFFKDLGSKVKGVFSGENSIGQKLKNATITGFHKVFNTTAVHKIREKLRKLKDEVVKTLKLTPEMMKSLKERLQPSWLNQFTKQTTATNDNYGMQYDYGSIMHYHGRSASINQKFTMVPFDVKYQETLGSPFISFIELSMLNEHYGCKKRCQRPGAAVCQNGGFPHPRDCNKCICPSGYGGPLCDRRPDGCGSTLQAKNEWQTLTDTVGLGRGEELEFEKCNYWIESPPNTKIEVKIDSFTRGLATDGCIYAGVEINTQKDQQLTGYRFCAPEDAGQRLTSYSNRVPIMTYNRAFKSTVVLQYRYIDAGGGQRPIIPVGPNDRKTIRPVIPNGGDGQRPVFPPSSRLTTKAAPTENCVDRVSCKDLARTKFCSSSISDATKRAICPKLCGFCN